MPTYKVEVKLLYTGKVEVEAPNPKTARTMVEEGEGELVLGSEEYKEFAGTTGEVEEA